MEYTITPEGDIYIKEEDLPKYHLETQIKVERRLCTVKGETGYFHTWEQYSKPLAASPLIGGEPAGVFSKIFGIVEFEDGIRRVDPTDIKFCD